MAGTPCRLAVDRDAAGQRLDRWLAVRVPALSRSRLQDLIETGHVRIDGAPGRSAHRLRGGETVDLEIPPLPPEELVPEPMPLAIVHEDADVLVVDKPAGVVVHPGAGHARGTLAAALLAHAPSIAGVGGPRRPGVVHRLDKETSGLLVVAKTATAYDSLTRQLAARTVSRCYLALVHGVVARAEGAVDAPIGRDPHDRIRMAVRPAGRGRRAVTHYRALDRYPDLTWLEARLETGRTHQIRVHLLSIGHPIYGDEVYRLRSRRLLPVPFSGIALHASTLAFEHPIARTRMEFSSPLPARIRNLLRFLQEGHAVC
jgi:23S rRNA pseudouridine1911/1915/1917 synthase